MTRKPDSKRKAGKQKPPKLEKETLKDLSADPVADEVKGGVPRGDVLCSYLAGQNPGSCK